MLEIVFNELSLNGKAASKGYAQSVYQDFFNLADNINSLKIAPVRIRMSVDIANRTISEEYYTVKDWIKSLPNEQRQRYLGFIVQDVIITDNPYFSIEGTDVVGLGYAFSNDLAAVSYSTNNVWINVKYEITRDYLPDGNSEVITDTVTVNHCVIQKVIGEYRVAHSKWLRDTYAGKQEGLINNLQSFDEFWEKKSQIFPWLDFGNEVNHHVRGYGSISDSNFKKVLRYLQSLNQHLVSVNGDNEIFDNLPGDVSNDSEATLNMYGEERTFTCHDGQQRKLSLHAKLGDVRIYMMPRKDEKRMVVGYIGKHLRTKKFNK
jgi:hypothetical protein